MPHNSNSRRNFVRKMGGLAGLLTVSSGLAAWKTETGLVIPEVAAAEDVTRDEDYWSFIQQAYSVSPNIINLNNGGVSPQPIVVQDALDRYNRLSNEAPTYYMWRTLDEAREAVRMKLADLGGCSPEEIAINRNASEAF